MLKKTVLLALCLMSVSPLFAQGEGRRKLRVALPGQPSSRYAGLYSAAAKGFYSARGLDVEFLSYQSPRKAAQALMKGEADAAVLTFSQAVLLRDGKEKSRPVLLAQEFPRSSLVLVGRKADGINKPSDVEGKTVSIFEDMQAQPRAFFKKYDIEVNFSTFPYGVNAFLRGAVALASVRRYDELYSLGAAGMRPGEMTVFSFDEHGINLPEDGIYGLESAVSKDTASLCGFAEASMSGWSEVVRSPEEAFRLVIKQLHESKIPASRIRQKRMLEGVLRLLPRDMKSGRPGRMTPEEYASASGLVEGDAGLVKQAPAYEAFVSGCAR